MNLNHRPRRLRANSVIRELVAETSFCVEKLILPIFVTEGKGIQVPNKYMPMSFTFSQDRLLFYLEKLKSLGINKLLLFGVTAKKDARGSHGLDKENVVVLTLKKIREKFPEFILATDVALDPYTDHGHDGIYENAKVLNDETVEVLAEMATLHAQSGAHIVAPSDMMDGRIGRIREALDSAHFSDVAILAYTAKYASSLYGPFRDTLDTKVIGDKKTYQMDYRNRKEAIRELFLDLDEGADFVMVKPASWYLDIISDFKAAAGGIPVAAYQVSGEVAMIEAAAKAGAFDRTRAISESVHSIFRAGADFLVTYYAEELAMILTR